jgi:hypothetical protein
VLVDMCALYQIRAVQYVAGSGEDTAPADPAVGEPVSREAPRRIEN